MKQFIYLDTDIVNSIIAQSEQGLIMSLTSENGSTSSDNIASTHEINTNGAIGGKLAFLAKAEANIAARIQTQSGVSSSDTSREIVSKTLHDAAFDIACSEINLQNVIIDQDDDCEIGSYVKMSRVFNYIDFEYLESLFDSDGLLDFIKKTQIEKVKASISAIFDNLNRDQKRNGEKKIKEKEKEIIKETNNQYDDVLSIIRLLRNMIPYSRMLVSSDGYLIPLDDDYFRIKPSKMGFKYGGEYTCVGIITNIIGEDTDPCDKNNVFATLQFEINKLLCSLLPTKEKNLYVIHPIAVFYGE